MSLHRIVQMLVAATFAMCASVAGSGLPLRAESPDHPHTVKLVVELVWEGRDLEDYNLDAIRRFRTEFSDVQIIHFISPAYFLKAGADPSAAVGKVRSVMRPGDRIGLTLSGWRSVTEQSGIIFRSAPTFWGETIRPLDCGTDCGEDVPVHLYPLEDLKKLVATSLKTLETNGFGKVRALQTSGWVASPEVLEAAALSGILYDFSSVSPEMLSKRARSYPVYGWARGLWPQVTPHTQPQLLTGSAASILEIPQSTAAIDYVTSQDMDVLFREYAEMSRRDPDRQLTFPLVFYQETASAMLPSLRRVLTGIFAYASTQGVSIAPLELPGIELSDTTMPVAH